MTRVGYLEGTDPLTLNHLVAREIDTIPLSNGFDNHGKFIGHITTADDIKLVIGYLHKVAPLGDSGLKIDDMLHACRVHKIPTLVIAQKSIHDEAVKLLGESSDYVTLVDPFELRDKIDSLIK